MPENTPQNDSLKTAIAQANQELLDLFPERCRHCPAVVHACGLLAISSTLQFNQESALDNLGKVKMRSDECIDGAVPSPEGSYPYICEDDLPA